MELQLRLPGDWPVGQYRRASIAPDAEDLESVVLWLQDAEINCWIVNAPPAHISVGLHDPAGGPDIRHDFQPVDGAWPRGAMARWLIETTRLYYRRVRS
ncbi:hypothetical protein [Reyranella sp.]|uniref:hypothetical protein n=1 Tax=Reyranella sp. TaxID=1929291 RepID=UPI003D0D73B5